MAPVSVSPGPLQGLFFIDLDVRADPDRPGASFREIFHEERFRELGLPDFRPVQWSISESTAGTLRGFHAEPWNKLIHVVAGEVFSAIADLRRGSDTAGEVWTGHLDRTRALFVGRGLGNAFQALSEVAVYAYLVDQHWRADVAYPAVAWNDPDLRVDWPITDERLALSMKDRTNPTLAQLWADG